MAKLSCFATKLPKSSTCDEDEGFLCSDIDDAKAIALNNKPHKHVHFGPYAEENDESQWSKLHGGCCFMVYKITIKNGTTCGIIKILNFIFKNIPKVFPILPYVNQENIVLLILDTAYAKQIQSLCEPIFQSAISVTQKYYSNKNVPTNEDLKEIMVQRFNTNNNSLDLSDLKTETRLPPNLLTSIPGIISLIKFIKKKYPHMKRLILKDNSFDDLEYVTYLALNCQNLKTLDISNNNLKSINELAILQFCSKLETLILRHNPFSLKCFGLEDYGRKIHRCLPRIKTLDEVDISSKQFYRNVPFPSTTHSSSKTKNENQQLKSHIPTEIITID